jgi:WD40 repeat protein
MSSNETTGVKRSVEDVSLHDNESSLRDCQQSFPDRVILPMNLIIGSILPFVQDRSTWNKLCVANKELKDAGRTITPPWPETTLQQAGFARSMVFSPCGHYLACAIASGEGNPPFVEILDRRNGQQTSLRGHIGDIFCLAFSGDGEYLASGGNESLIRIWPTNSTKKPTQQSRDKTLPGHTTEIVNCLAFASDSNILASGSYGEIKLWNVEDGVCTQSFDQLHTKTISLVFKGVGESIQCLAATADGSLIRISRNSGHSEFTNDRIVEGATPFRISAFSHCGSFLTTVDLTNKLCLYEVKTDCILMRQSVTLPAYCRIRTNAGMTFSADNKMLAVISDRCREDDTVVRLLDVKDLTLQRQLKWQLRGQLTVSLAVDQSSRYLATSWADGRVRIWTV